MNSLKAKKTGTLTDSLTLLGLFLAVALVALQLTFFVRVGLMRFNDPTSTTFERSEAVRIWREKGQLPWRQSWIAEGEISDHLKRAVIASEDAGFVDHTGVEWEALEKAWQKNAAAEQRATRPASQGSTTRKAQRSPKVVGASTISQQLAKNLFLTGERNLPRKAQELVLTLAIEAMLPKDRILEIYLNHVEWGEGVFGAQAAAQHYFKKNANRLSPMEAARLAVMLPAPKRFEKMPNSPYLASRAQTIVARMADVELP